MRDVDRKYLKVDGNAYLFNIPGDERERASPAKKELGRLAATRADWQAWNTTIGFGYSARHLPQNEAEHQQI